MDNTTLKKFDDNSTPLMFLRFLREVGEKGYFKGAKWGFTDGFSNQYMSFSDFARKVNDQIKSKKDTDSPIANYFIWQIQADGVDKTEIDNALKDGLSGILELGRDNKDITFEKIVTSFKSKSQEEFGKFMGSGSGGSLDESEESSDVSLGALGQELADEMESLLSKKNKELEESDIVVTAEGILSTVLASTTFINIISGWVGSFMKKRNFKKGAKGADKIYDFTHKLESLFKYPIKLIVGRFTKDKKVIAIVTDSIYALLILTLGVRAGGAALEAASLKNAGAGAVKGLKAALKGKDLATLIKDIASVAKAAV